MSRETDGWRAAIAAARAEGHAAGVAEGRRFERAEAVAVLRDTAQAAAEWGDVERCRAFKDAARVVERRGSPEGGAESAPPVPPEAPTSAPVTRDVSSVVEGAAGGQGERGGQEP